MTSFTFRITKSIEVTVSAINSDVAKEIVKDDYYDGEYDRSLNSYAPKIDLIHVGQPSN